MTRQERRLVLFLTAAAVVGLGVRWVQTREAAVRVEVRAAATGSGPHRSGGLRAPLVALNQASAEDLLQLPGIGPSLAARIVAYRDAEGPFASVEDLEAVPGIGPATIERVRELLTLE